MDVLAVGDPRRGRHVTVTWEGWRGARPAAIADHDGRQWTVENIVDHWTHPDRHSRDAKVPYGVEAERWTLTVLGPLAYRPHETGRVNVALRTFNDGAGWYLLAARDTESSGCRY